MDTNMYPLGRLPEFDPASRAYPIRTLVGDRRPRSYTWACGTWLDQGREGSCVGHAWAHELAARPKPVLVGTAEALRIYRRAQQLDAWPGEDYEGSSVLAGAKAVQELGLIAEYRWAFGLDDLVLAVGYAGPAVLGLNWYSGMYRPDQHGVIRPSGDLAGGHAILCRGVSVRTRTFRLRNSWGHGWGLAGDCLIGFDDMGQLLAERGEACIPVVRLR